MKFIDEAEIKVKAGDGGAGFSHFRREKYVPLGGPDGGNGGNGGSIILIADRNKHTLIDFKFKPIWIAESGNAGEKRLKEGKSGDNLTIHVPIGTQVLNQKGELIKDLEQDGQEFILAQGGRGGKGNAHFKSATNRSPEKKQPGTPGEEGTFTLSLKLVADVGLIGFPNAGKSTLISTISSARPKIADYPFTTITPNLGVVKANDKSFVIADIPGLIPGAHTGKGLGTQFLKHVERTKILVHLIDPMHIDEKGNIVDPLQSCKLLNKELKNFSDNLAEKKQIIALTKMDSFQDTEKLDSWIDELKKTYLDCICISSVDNTGIKELINKLHHIVH